MDKKYIDITLEELNTAIKEAIKDDCLSSASFNRILRIIAEKNDLDIMCSLGGHFMCFEANKK